MSDPWQNLRRFTQARIGLGRCGHALPTPALLELQAAHARARDAVLQEWAVDDFARSLGEAGEDALILETCVSSRSEYLRRPDLGRRLTDSSRDTLRRHVAGGPPFEVLVLVTNGLSSTAVERHGLPLLKVLLAQLRQAGIRIGPIGLAVNGRVALSDDAGAASGARLTLMVVGERPGLSAADSLGLYLTYAPRIGNTDAQRNCISNVRPPEGLTYGAAAAKSVFLAREALRLGLSGVGLKDTMDAEIPLISASSLNDQPGEAGPDSRSEPGSGTL